MKSVSLPDKDDQGVELEDSQQQKKRNLSNKHNLPKTGGKTKAGLKFSGKNNPWNKMWILINSP